MQTITKKRVAGSVAVITIIALLLTGTYAFSDNSQHKTNLADGDGIRHAVHLVEDYEPIENWKVDDGPKEKAINVKNMGGTKDYATGEWGDVYVRLQLKEYMEIAQETYVYSENYFTIDTAGKFVKFADKNAGISAGYKSEDLMQMQGHFDDQKYWYVKTQEGDSNGQIGKQLLINIEAEDPVSLVPGVARDYTTNDGTNYHKESNAAPHKTGQCDYTVHQWGEDGGAPFTEYIKWLLGETNGNPNYILIEDWDGTAVDKWIIDTNSTEGWVYWGQALKPGVATSNILDQIQLIKQPDGAFHYEIHTDMEAVDYSELGNWADMPGKVKDGYDKELGIDNSLRAQLEEKIKEAEAILADGSRNYTDETKQALQDTIDAGKEILNNEASVENNFQTGIKDIDDAIKGLIAWESMTEWLPTATPPIIEPEPAPSTESTAPAVTDPPATQPTTEDTKLPTKTPNASDGFAAAENDDPDYDFRAVIESSDVGLPENQRVVSLYPQPDITLSYGYIQLKNVLSGTDYSNVKITVPSQYKDLIYIGADQYGDASIVFKAVPTIAQCKTSSPENPRIPVNVTLEQNGKTAAITIVMTYDGMVIFL